MFVGYFEGISIVKGDSFRRERSFFIFLRDADIRFDLEGIL